MIDPSGFADEPPEKPPILPIRVEITRDAEGTTTVNLFYPPRVPKAEAEQVGASVPPVDVGTTGSTASFEPDPTTSAPPSWTQHPLAQIEAGVLGGVCLGLVPFAGMGEEVLEGTGALPPGTPEFSRGKALGLMAAGLAEMAGGAAGEVIGGLLTSTGIGAALGVPAIAGSTVVVVGGAANVMAGVAGLMSSGSGSATPRQPPQGAAPATKGAPKLHVGQQGKHIPQHNNYIPGRSPFTHRDPQGLLDKFAGKGDPVGKVPRGQPGFRERVDFGEIIGEVSGQPTTKGIIHYSKDGAHIVPANP